jgi:hypothetical protein
MGKAFYFFDAKLVWPAGFGTAACLGSAKWMGRLALPAYSVEFWRMRRGFALDAGRGEVLNVGVTIRNYNRADLHRAVCHVPAKLWNLPTVVWMDC